MHCEFYFNIFVPPFFLAAVVGLELRSLFSFPPIVQVDSYEELVLAGHLPPQDQIKVPRSSVVLHQQ